MELVPESSQWLSSSWGEVEPLFQNDLITFPSSLPLDGDFSGFTASINPKDAESANCSSFVSPQNPPLDNGMNVDSCDESFKPSFSVPPPAFFPLFLSPSLEAPVHAGSSPSDSVPTRKRRKRDTPPSLLPPPSQVTNLLKLEGVVDSVDSITFESFVAELRNFRSLSTAEESLVKRVTKKIKNRESARKSRQAKKDHNADLETRVSDLVDQTQDLKIVCMKKLLSLTCCSKLQHWNLRTVKSEERSLLLRT